LFAILFQDNVVPEGIDILPDILPDKLSDVEQRQYKKLLINEDIVSLQNI